MQLAGLLDDELARPGRRPQRGPEADAAAARRAQLEAGWSKTQILEAYLNRVPLRGEAGGRGGGQPGCCSASTPAASTPIEAALARGAWCAAPNAAPALLERRACECCGSSSWTARGLAHHAGAGAGAPAAARCRAAGRGAGAAPGAPHGRAAARRPLAQHARRRACSAWRWRALRRQLAELRGREVEDGAVLVLDNASGEVLAWVGSSGSASSAPAVDAVLARRQPGSTIKPFVYALALQQRLITAASRARRRAAAAGRRRRRCTSRRTTTAASRGGQRAHGAGRQPERAGGARGRHARARRRLRHARRCRPAPARERRLPRPRAGAGQRRGHAAGPHQRLPHLRARRRLEPGALACRHAGGAARAASSTPPRPSSSPTSWPTPRRVPLTFGLDSPLVTRGWAAVKTGTSKDMRDNWCIGFTRPLHGGRVGRQCRRRADARRERRQRRGAGVARGGARTCTRGHALARRRQPPPGLVRAARRVVPGRHRAARRRRRRGRRRRSPSASSRRATAAWCCSTPTSRWPRSAWLSSARRGAGGSTAGRWAAAASCTGCRGRAATCWSAPAGGGADAAVDRVAFEVRAARAAEPPRARQH